MQAILITAASQTLELIEINSLQEIKDQIGFDTIETDEVGDQGDLLYFDEECFIRGGGPRFQIDSLIPVAGNGVILGGTAEAFKDVNTDLEDLRARVKFS